VISWEHSRLSSAQLKVCSLADGGLPPPHISHHIVPDLSSKVDDLVRQDFFPIRGLGEGSIFPFFLWPFTPRRTRCPPEDSFSAHADQIYDPPDLKPQLDSPPCETPLRLSDLFSPLTLLFPLRISKSRAHVWDFGPTVNQAPLLSPLTLMGCPFPPERFSLLSKAEVIVFSSWHASCPGETF